MRDTFESEMRTVKSQTEPRADRTEEVISTVASSIQQVMKALNDQQGQMRDIMAQQERMQEQIS